MAIKLKDGVYALGSNGIPQTADDLEELLDDAYLCLKTTQGSFIYDRELGSLLNTVDQSAEHAEELALSFADEALLRLPGVSAEAVSFSAGGAMEFTISTPLGSGSVSI